MATWNFFIRGAHLLRESFDNLRSSSRRSVLTLSGIVVGCVAVVALINIGHNLQIEAAGVFHGMGSDLLVANIELPSFGDAFNTQNIVVLDAGLLRKAIPNVVAASPLMPSSVEARLNGRSINVTLLGTNNELVKVLHLELAQGRFLAEFDGRSTSIVIGSRVADRWKQAGVSVGLGTQIALGGYLFDVIGVLRRNGENPFLPVNVDDSILTGMEGMRRVVASPYVSNVVVRSTGGDMSSNIAHQLQQWLERRLPNYSITVQIPQELIEGMVRQSRLFSWLLAGIGAIALLVGGIGVMNVMVMSVSERRREIGVRMALGARPIDIAGLFLMESVLLAITGAVIGAPLGMVAAGFFVHFAGWSSFTLSWSSVMLGVGSAVLTGLFFGLSPSLSAARLTPTQALRDD